MATIKAIEGRSVHQIQSGQVIVDLISVVKELVENSLDAGATSIEVRFKNHGLDSIEVQDNGKGIAPEDFETIALKHYTSKLSSYEDLTSLDTFGFRGEALSSLCALSKFQITTARSQDDAVGKKLEFETSGQLKSSTVVAAQRGTTVLVENLFGNLPVRRKELEKNIKREYGKAINNLYAYACISVGVRFSVNNQMPKANKVPVFSTKSNTTTKENITNVFGAKTLLALVKLDLQLEMEPSKGPLTQSARNWSTQAIDRSMEVRVQGHISKPIFGEGRQAPDRQMFFVNSRPCLLPQVTKAFNEVYKSFNVSQSPFIFANLIMDTNAYDVNVSPDKRSIMLHDQTALLEKLKSSLTELFEQTDHTVPQSQLPNRKLPSYKALSIPQWAVPETSALAEGEESAEDSEDGEDQTEFTAGNTRRKRALPNGPTPSLIQNWVERDTEMRSEKPASKKPQNQTPKDKQNLITAAERESVESSEENGVEDEQGSDMGTSAVIEGRHSPNEDSDSVQNAVRESLSVDNAAKTLDPMGSPFDDLFSQRAPHLPKPVQDFNALMDQRRALRQSSLQPDGVTTDRRESAPEKDSEPIILAIAPSSQKAAPGPIQNAFDRMRPKRTPLQTAEITVGDTTTTAVIGSSPPYKKRRIHQPVHSQSIAEFGGSPLLARGLRNFAAPGSQMETDSSNIPAINHRPPESSDSDSEDGSTKAVEDTSTRQNEEAAAHVAKFPSSSNAPISDPLNELVSVPADDVEFDEDYVDEHEKKRAENEKVARLIQEAEIAAASPTEENLKRAAQVLKNTGNRRESTLQLAQYLETSVEKIKRQLDKFYAGCGASMPIADGDKPQENAIVKDEIDDSNAESRLSLTVSKSDFDRMEIIGQFNLGFILAVRPNVNAGDEDDLFIIDQHAADEKYNYERLQRTVTLQNQRLVRPKALDLTAIEEEIILNNADALKANGFEIETVSVIAEDEPAGRRCRLLTLPMSKEKTFEVSDLEELLHLLSEAPAGSSEIPRPKKVQSMLAMRACRSSIMVGKTLTPKQMSKVVRHMGEMEKPWNCPHGRPTMRHLAGLGAWKSWVEGEASDEDDEMGVRSPKTDWKGFLERRA